MIYASETELIYICILIYNMEAFLMPKNSNCYFQIICELIRLLLDLKVV